MKEDESWEDPKIYFERLEKFALSLGYKYDDEENGFPTYDMLMEIERLREEKKRLREAIDNIAKGMDANLILAKGMDEDWRHWRNELEKVIE
tara:strand:- start:1046 stop:1321 length:276 start_codon:yes stop_codon:yes gene_type:complete